MTNQTAPCEGEVVREAAERLAEDLQEGRIKDLAVSRDVATILAALSPAPTAPVGVTANDIAGIIEQNADADERGLHNASQLAQRIYLAIASASPQPGCPACKGRGYLMHEGGDSEKSVTEYEDCPRCASPHPGEGGGGDPVLWGCADGNVIDPGQVYRDRSDADFAAESFGLRVQPLYDHPASDSRDGVVEALRRSAEGWTNALELKLLPPQHRQAAEILRDEALAALSTVRGGGALRPAGSVPAGGKPETEGPPL